MAKKKKQEPKKDDGAPGAPPEPPPPPPPPTIHEASLASGPSGAVEYGSQIDELTAVALRKAGQDVVRGEDEDANRLLAYRIENGAGAASRPQFPHRRTAGPRALPHFHQRTRVPTGHTFYETENLKASKKP